MLLDALVVWSLLLAVSVAGIPLAGVLLGRLPGGGLPFARPVGLLVAAYPVWLLASLHAVPYGALSPWLALASLVLVAGAAWRWGGHGRPDRAALRLWLAGEAVFTAAFLAWVVLRSYAPDVWGTEKPMDMAFVNAIDRSEWFPPADPWFAGESLNYYYLGHLLVALLTRAGGLDPTVGFNLGVAVFYGLAAAAVFGLAATVLLASRRRPRSLGAVPAGLVAVAFAMVLGNLAAATQLAGDPGPLREYDWWSPSRVVAGTANEFPFFSFLLGDLHAHVMATPFALVAVAYALQLAVGPAPGSGGRARAAAELALAALVLGALYAVNTLDYPTALAVVTGGLLLAVTRRESPLRLRHAAAWGAALAGGSALLVAPFITSFTPETRGLGLVVEHEPFTRFGADLVLVYALPLWVLAAALAYRLRVPRRYLAWSGVALMVVLVLLAPSRLAGLFLLLTLTAVALHAALDARLEVAQRFFWLLAAVGLGLVAVGDFAYIRDAFEDTPSYRFNTVFKAGYQAWFLLAVVAAVGLAWSGSWLRREVRRAWLTGLAVLLALLTVYPVAGTWARTEAFSPAPTLEGDRWLERDAPDDAAAVRWLRENVSGTPAIVEAVGADFSPSGHGRVSTFTGLPAVLGWAGHELQWGREVAARARDVPALYATRDVALARRLLRRYDVRYVFVGSLERDQYPSAGLAKFARLGRPVFRSGRTVVYAVGG